MKFYVASKFENKDNVRACVKWLKEAGHTCTFDWTYATTSVSGNRFEAQKDIDGVKECDFFVFLANVGPDTKYLGSLIELGMALAWNKLILIIGTDIDTSVFNHAPNVVMVKWIEMVPPIIKAHKWGIDR